MFQLVGKEYARLDFAGAEAGRTRFLDIYVDSWAHSLACYLHQSELAQRQDVVACAVVFHLLAHPFVEHLPVFGKVHVDEVHHDDASHVAQSQLAGYLVGSSEVRLECVLLLSVFLLGAVSAVHVDYVHSLCVLNDEIGAVLVVHCFAEPRLQLLRNVEVVEYGQLASVEFHYARLFRGYLRNIVSHGCAYLLIVYVDVLVGGIEQVAHHGHSPACFLKHQLWQLLTLLYLGDGIVPSLHENFHFGVEFGNTLALSNGAYYHAEVFG